METDYHTSSYQVEELKSNEAKLMRQLGELEKQKQELNELRLRDLDTQIVLQDRLVDFMACWFNFMYLRDYLVANATNFTLSS